MKPIFPTYSIGHFINQPDNHTEFELTQFGQMEEPDVEDPHKHTFYEIIWIDSGKSKQTIDYTEYALSPQSLFFISPGQLHFFEEWAHLAGGSILFTEDFFLLNYQNKDRLFELTFLDNVHTNACICPDEESYAAIRHTINLIFVERQHPDCSMAICQSLLHILLQQIQRSINHQSEQLISKRYLIVYKNFKSLLDSHFTRNITAATYAAMLHITQHHLNFITKHVTGKTTTEVIRARSILEAKRLLTFTDLTVLEVASQLNYFDSSYFAKIFRTEVGLSPNKFRVDNQKK